LQTDSFSFPPVGVSRALLGCPPRTSITTAASNTEWFGSALIGTVRTCTPSDETRNNATQRVSCDCCRSTGKCVQYCIALAYTMKVPAKPIVATTRLDPLCCIVLFVTYHLLSIPSRSLFSLSSSCSFFPVGVGTIVFVIIITTVVLVVVWWK